MTHSNTHDSFMCAGDSRLPFECWFCNTPQHAATRCHTLPHAATYYNTLQHTGWSCDSLVCEGDNRWPHLQRWHCNTLQHTASHCNTLQHTATHCNTLQHTATHCNTLHHTAPHYDTLQHAATRCNTLQHAATHCNTQATADELTSNVGGLGPQVLFFWHISLIRLFLTHLFSTSLFIGPCNNSPFKVSFHVISL